MDDIVLVGMCKGSSYVDYEFQDTVHVKLWYLLQAREIAELHLLYEIIHVFRNRGKLPQNLISLSFCF